jgi:hypothetical protein
MRLPWEFHWHSRIFKDFRTLKIAFIDRLTVGPTAEEGEDGRVNGIGDKMH